MSYFPDNYQRISFPVPTEESPVGLYPAQIGAISAIQSHFTLSDNAAVVTMPTGSGKTAVLMMTPYVLRAKKVLVITPSRIVRNQIFKDFEFLKTLKKIGVLPEELISPKTLEVKSKLKSESDWQDLNIYDVAISTPNCISPAIGGVCPAPEDFFDLILIDEAHHSAAQTWDKLLSFFPNAKKVLFTATPFRRDKKEIKGDFIYSYPIEKSFNDETFGKIKYLPVNLERDADADNDSLIAQKAEEVFNEDRGAGLDHYLMVRVDSKDRANHLLEVYERETDLNLQVIHSGHSNARADKAIAKLKNKELDGIICVNMFGEGFDFPKLKIAAVHTPHKSLEVTLQFIGRFARTNADDIGEAKFIGAVSDIEIEEERLFNKNSFWQDLIVDLSQDRISQENRSKSFFKGFKDIDRDLPDFENFSFHSLRPRFHAKVVRTEEVVDIENLDLDLGENIVVDKYQEEEKTRLIITESIKKPQWIQSDKLASPAYNLIILYFDETNKLFFINSNKSSDNLYLKIHQSLGVPYRGLPMNVINRVISKLTNVSHFNVGMRKKSIVATTDSYKQLAGKDAAKAIKRSDGRLYEQGHVFCRGEKDGKFVVIGYSSGSKFWGMGGTKISGLVDWCKEISTEINDNRNTRTNSSLDMLGASRELKKVPLGIMGADWPLNCYDLNHPIVLRDNTLLSSLEIKIHSSNETQIEFSVTHNSATFPFTYDIADPSSLFTFNGAAQNDLILEIGGEGIRLEDLFNITPPFFFTGDLLTICGLQISGAASDIAPLDEGIMVVQDWKEDNVDITNECQEDSSDGISIQNWLENKLVSDDSFQIVICDHGTGETADFITIKNGDNEVEVSLFHCKASDSLNAGSRVADTYEVCMQAIRSLHWTTLSGLRKKLEARVSAEKFKKGEAEELWDILDSRSGKSFRYKIVIVQPGFSKGKLREEIKKVISATNDYIDASNDEGLEVWCSE